MKYKLKDNKDQISFSFRKRSSWKNNGWLLLGLLIIFGFSAHAAWKVYLNNKESEQAAADSEKQLATLQDRQAFLSDQLVKLQTAEGRESSLREKFGVGKPGENLAIIVSVESTSTATSTSGFWLGIKNFFTHLFSFGFK